MPPVSAARRIRPATRRLSLRPGTAADAEALHALIAAHQAEGHLLPRGLDELRRRATRFVVGEARGRIVACAELAPLSRSVAEIRSLVVAPEARGAGGATRMVDALRRRAVAAGFETLAAFTHDARFFVRQNFSMVPHAWVPAKVLGDCAACPLAGRCGQHAMVLSLKEMVCHAPHVLEHRQAAVA